MPQIVCQTGPHTGNALEITESRDLVAGIHFGYFVHYHALFATPYPLLSSSATIDRAMGCLAADAGPAGGQRHLPLVTQLTVPEPDLPRSTSHQIGGAPAAACAP